MESNEHPITKIIDEFKKSFECFYQFILMKSDKKIYLKFINKNDEHENQMIEYKDF
jgi:hypothetical protein